MTKKNSFLKAAGLMMGATMLMTCIIGGSLANYQTKKDDISASATAAKWEIKVNDTELSKFATPLAFEVYENTGNSYNQTADDEVKGAEGAKVIAPGTYGVSTLTVENASEVDAKISAAITGGSLPEGMKLYVGTKGATALTAEDFKAASEWSEAVDLAASLDPEGTTTLTIAYDWAFGSDGADTDSAGDPITLGTLTLTATQVD